MASIPICIRIDGDLDAHLTKEAKRRKQDKADLIRTFIRDGLAHYESGAEQMLQTQQAILEQLTKFREVTGATVHLVVEQTVLGLPQAPNETREAYKERLMATYRTMVFEALEKGARIAAAALNTPASPKVGHDH